MAKAGLWLTTPRSGRIATHPINKADDRRSCGPISPAGVAVVWAFLVFVEWLADRFAGRFVLHVESEATGVKEPSLGIILTSSVLLIVGGQPYRLAPLTTKSASRSPHSVQRQQPRLIFCPRRRSRPVCRPMIAQDQDGCSPAQPSGSYVAEIQL
jgi:hypothetical protein